MLAVGGVAERTSDEHQAFGRNVDLVLRVILACMMNVASVVHILGVHPHDPAGDRPASEFQVT